MTNRIDSILANFRPNVIQRTAGDRPGEIKVIPGPDLRQLQDNVSDAKEMSTKEVLQKYDLRSINKTEMYSLVSILREKRAISEETADSLSGHALLAFEDEPDDKKMDFVVFLEGLANQVFNGPDPVGERETKILKMAITEARSIEFARSTGAEQITIDVNV